MISCLRPVAAAAAAAAVLAVGVAAAQTAARADASAVSPPSFAEPVPGAGVSVPVVTPVRPKPVLPPGVPTPPDFIIGPDDVLLVLFWRDKELSAEVSVRPDGNISLPLLNDVRAAGLTPEQLRVALMDHASQFITDPNATVVVKQINSRKVFVTGQVEKPGPYPLTSPTTVLQLLSLAGGLREFADGENISIMRTVNGRPVSLRFDYKSVARGKKLAQNIDLKPGDTIVVP